MVSSDQVDGWPLGTHTSLSPWFLPVCASRCWTPRPSCAAGCLGGRHFLSCASTRSPTRASSAPSASSPSRCGYSTLTDTRLSLTRHLLSHSLTHPSLIHSLAGSLTTTVRRMLRGQVMLEVWTHILSYVGPPLRDADPQHSGAKAKGGGESAQQRQARRLRRR